MTCSGTFVGNVATGGHGGHGLHGGAGGNGGLGGNGEGGGLFVDATDTVALTDDLIALNQALAADGHSVGLGGGVFLSSPGSTASATKIRRNFASTADPDVHGSFSPGP
jgi:hypothetical protein